MGLNKMEPLPGNRVPTPEIGGNQAGIEPVTTPPAGDPGGQVNPESPGETKPEMSSGEKYWHDEAIKARELYAEVAPLAPYVEVIGYLDANPSAVSLVMGHMREANPDIVNQNPELNGVINAPPPVTSNAPVRGNNVNPPMGDPSAAIEQKLREEHMDLIKQQGIPEHEVDRYIKFLMSPGELKPNELFSMYQNLRAGRGDVVSTAPTPEAGQPVAQAATPPEMPPMSIAGMNGMDSETDPRKEEEINARAQVRHVLDPNNI